MRDFIDRFTLDAIKFDYQVLAGMVIIWMLVVVCSIHSLLNQRIKPSTRNLWIAVILGLPVIGVLFYLPFSFRLENYPDLFIWKKSKANSGKK